MAALEIFKNPNFKLVQDATDSEAKKLIRKDLRMSTKQVKPIMVLE